MKREQKVLQEQEQRAEERRKEKEFELRVNEIERKLQEEKKKEISELKKSLEEEIKRDFETKHMALKQSLTERSELLLEKMKDELRWTLIDQRLKQIETTGLELKAGILNSKSAQQTDSYQSESGNDHTSEATRSHLQDHVDDSEDDYQSEPNHNNSQDDRQSESNHKDGTAIITETARDVTEALLQGQPGKAVVSLAKGAWNGITNLVS